MTGSPYQKTMSLALPAAVATGIATAQSGTSGTSLTINGSLATAGVANLVTPQRVIVTSAGDDSNKTFSIVGTDRYGRAQTETLTGANGVATTKKDFLTVTAIIPSANTASTVTSGTVGIGSTVPLVVDAFINGSLYGASTTVTGTANYTIEKSSDDLAPNYDLNANIPTWYPATGFSAQTTSIDGNIQGPCNLIRLTINSGTGNVAARIIMSFLAGRA